MVNKDDVREAAQRTAWNPVAKLADMGVRPGHAYTAAFISIGLSVASWTLSRKSSSRPQADRWGLFIGQWAPTFLALGIALEKEKRS
ncbi:hypothetical protein FB566_1841 [Stackebrandtia endophytica]|uniref:Uncharacterized protein n=1 Tax=Stackebrandtia endophytica TaxID=1496996 RepID=A0A543AUS7_9ACTN|nr:hypothetical protein [Stackebrandtia endophytica]TQL76315.1 hypothetical protein FB566_1841 [Stackebrandtia endophytica]